MSRTDDEIRSIVLTALAGVAPELEPDTLDPAQPIRDQVDIDSMDFLNLVIALDEELGVSIPEADYGRLTTLDGFVAYLRDALASR